MRGLVGSSSLARSYASMASATWLLHDSYNDPRSNHTSLQPSQFPSIRQHTKPTNLMYGLILIALEYASNASLNWLIWKYRTPMLHQNVGLRPSRYTACWYASYALLYFCPDMYARPRRYHDCASDASVRVEASALDGWNGRDLRVQIRFDTGVRVKGQDKQRKQSRWRTGTEPPPPPEDRPQPPRQGHRHTQTPARHKCDRVVAARARSLVADQGFVCDTRECVVDGVSSERSGSVPKRRACQWQESGREKMTGAKTV